MKYKNVFQIKTRSLFEHCTLPKPVIDCFLHHEWQRLLGKSSKRRKNKEVNFNISRCIQYLHSSGSLKDYKKMFVVTALLKTNKIGISRIRLI